MRAGEAGSILRGAPHLQCTVAAQARNQSGFDAAPLPG